MNQRMIGWTDVWVGMEWNEMEWNGMDWNGTEWMDGTEWSGWNGIMGEWSQRNALPVTEGMDEQQK